MGYQFRILLLCSILTFSWASIVPQNSSSIEFKISEILRKNPRLDHVGTYNGRNYFLERDHVDQYTARAECKKMGMNLARFESQEALNYIGFRSAEDLCWTDGHSSTYVWENGFNIPSDLILADNGVLGLVTDFFTSFTKLKAFPAIETDHPYLCMT